MWGAHFYFSFFSPQAISLDDHFNKIDPIVVNQERVHTRLVEPTDSSLQLNRLDLEIGLNKSGEFGILGYGAQSALELIWERKKIPIPALLAPSEEKKGIEITIEPQTPQTLHENIIANEVRKFAEWKNFNPRKRRRILRHLYRDAQRINRLVEALRTLPQFGYWYADGFFKTYQFSKQGDLVGTVSAGVDLRVRFRFQFKGSPKPYSQNQILSPLQKSLLPMLVSLNHYTESEKPHSRFELKRVWMRSEIEKEFNAILFSTSLTKGFQLVFRKSKFLAPTPQDLFQEKPLLLSAESQSRRLFDQVKSFQNEPSKTETHSKLVLNQIRLKLSLSKELGFFISTVGTQSTLDLHFFQRERHEALLHEPDFNSPRILQLDQVDYRKRLTFGIGVPGVAHLRVRPSIEHRYVPKE